MKMNHQDTKTPSGTKGFVPLVSSCLGGSLRRYWTVYVALWRNSIIREMSFKTNFLLWIVVELLWFALQLSFIAVIYSHTDHIGDWTKWEVVLLMGTAHFIQQIFQAFFLTNCTELSELIRTGRLDFMLLLPVNTRFLISLRKVDLGSFVNALSALAVIGYSLYRLQLMPSAMQIIGFGSLRVHRNSHPLLAHVSAHDGELLDGPRARDHLGLLQSLQYFADAGRRVSRRVQSCVHVCAAHGSRRQCSGESARRKNPLTRRTAPAGRDDARLRGGVRNRLALLRETLHQRQQLNVRHPA